MIYSNSDTEIIKICKHPGRMMDACDAYVLTVFPFGEDDEVAVQKFTCMPAMTVARGIG